MEATTTKPISWSELLSELHRCRKLGKASILSVNVTGACVAWTSKIEKRDEQLWFRTCLLEVLVTQSREWVRPGTRARIGEKDETAQRGV